VIKVLFMALAALGAVVVGVALVPWRDPAVRRRAVFLGLLPAPAVLLVAFGPFGFIRGPYSDGLRATLLKAQNVGLGAAILLALVLVAWLPGARRGALLLGALAAFATLVVAGANEIVIDPRS
jgi:hypothetical protein